MKPLNAILGVVGLKLKRAAHRSDADYKIERDYAYGTESLGCTHPKLKPYFEDGISDDILAQIHRD